MRKSVFHIRFRSGWTTAFLIVTGAAVAPNPDFQIGVKAPLSITKPGRK